MFPVLVALALPLAVCLIFTRRRRNVTLPPGPPGYPVIGNIKELNKHWPDKHSWEVYAELSAAYGDIIYMEVFKQPVIILNSAQAGADLMEKRSSNYSDRPACRMMGELMGWKWNFALMEYSDCWRLHRKTFHQYFQPRVMPSYYPTLLDSNTVFLQALLSSPESFIAHTRSHAARIVLKISYDYDLQPDNDGFVELAAEAMDGMANAFTPGSFWVDFIPALKYVPAWFPGASFQRRARRWKEATLGVRDIPYKQVKERIAQGEASSSFVAKNLCRFESAAHTSEDMETVIKNCAGVTYFAGADTSASTVLSFILAMVLNPSVMKKAQEEIDQVVGTSRLPDFDDRDHLPYVEAILSEVLRWMPVVPLSIAHKSVHDDIYRNYLIPGGSTVISNLWAMLHDTNVYPNPSAFLPERFLPLDGPKPPDPINLTFGLGRRICPGRYLAVNTAWISIVGILSTFDITPVRNEYGEILVPTVDCNEGTVCHPLPFECCITPRSERAAELIGMGHTS